MSMPIASELLEILRCPRCKGQLRAILTTVPALECPTCRLRFAVRDGIPIMLIDDATAF
ncbi:MAG: Trm112 family protein [Gemmatimonadaceae bacterium]|nr:Trm112 family protein [Gemmatimonadaceae bacterium]